VAYHDYAAEIPPRNWLASHAPYLPDIMPPSRCDTSQNFFKLIALHLLPIMSEPVKGMKVSVDDSTFNSNAGQSLVYKLEEDENREEQLGFWNENID
jgi:hypothetical protein